MSEKLINFEDLPYIDSDDTYKYGIRVFYCI